MTLMVSFAATWEGETPGLLMHNVEGGFFQPPDDKKELDRLNSLSPKDKKLAANVEARERLDWKLGLYRDDQIGRVILPPKLPRAGIHAAAKLSRDGQRVNRGVQVISTEFNFPDETAPIDDLFTMGDTYVHRSVVNVQRQRIMRIRPLFRTWSVIVEGMFDPEMVSADTLTEWMTVCGRTIGLGDWRPDKGGEFGRFTVEEFRSG